MDKQTYINQLLQLLAGKLPQEELESIRHYYEEYFAELEDEDQVQGAMAGLGTPRQVAEHILQEWEGDVGATPLPQTKARIPWWAFVLGGVLAIFLIVCVSLLAYHFARREPVTTVTAQPPSVSVEAPQRTPLPSPSPSPSPSPLPSPSPSVEGRHAVSASTLDAFRELTIEIGVGSIILEEGEDFALETEWYGLLSDMQYDIQDGELEITCALAGKIDQEGGVVRVTVPKGTILEDIDLYTGVGSIDVTLSATEENYSIDLAAGLGEVYISGKKVSNVYEQRKGIYDLDCATGIGSINISLDN